MQNKKKMKKSFVCKIAGISLFMWGQRQKLIDNDDVYQNQTIKHLSSVQWFMKN